MGLQAIYQKPRTTLAGEPSGRFPCLVEFNKIRVVEDIFTSMHLSFRVKIL